MRRDGHAVNRSNLTPGENAILSEIEQQDGKWLVPYAWLKLCLHGDRTFRPDFPVHERALTRSLRALQKWNWIEHLVTPDRGAWYLPKATWDAISPEIKDKVHRGLRTPARGTAGRVTICRIGPIHDLTLTGRTPFGLRLKDLPKGLVVGPGKGVLTISTRDPSPAQFICLTFVVDPEAGD